MGETNVAGHRAFLFTIILRRFSEGFILSVSVSFVINYVCNVGYLSLELVN